MKHQRSYTCRVTLENTETGKRKIRSIECSEDGPDLTALRADMKRQGPEWKLTVEEPVASWRVCPNCETGTAGLMQHIHVAPATGDEMIPMVKAACGNGCGFQARGESGAAVVAAWEAATAAKALR